MRFTLIYCLLIVFQPFVKSQYDYSGLYVNYDSNEFICFYGDTLQFRIHNKDAFGTYSLGIGKYEIDNKGVLHLNFNTIIDQTSVINKCPRNDNKLFIRFLKNDDEPMEFATIKIGNKKGRNYEIVSFSDKNGLLSLNEEQITLLNKDTSSIHIETVGFVSEKIILFELGYDYVIKSKIPEKFPFTIFQEANKFIIERISSKCIKIEMENVVKSDFCKIDINLQYFNFLFEKDFADPR